jgi:hypothetical protein
MSQEALFEQDPDYCLDTNVFVSFLVEDDEEHYGRDVFGPQWEFVESLISSGRIVAPRQVERELERWTRSNPEIHEWVGRHRYMFRDIVSAEQLAMAKRIVNDYPVYGETVNYLGDLEVITLAHALGVPVVSMERGNSTLPPSRRRPKIPSVCHEYGIECLTFPAFLRRETFGFGEG